MTSPTATTTTTTTTAYRKLKTEAKEVAAIEKDVVRDQVLLEPVIAEATYPNLVSIFGKNEFISNIQLKWSEIY